MLFFGWIIFIVVILSVLAIDLFIFNKEAHKVRFKEALIWSVVWVLLALLFDIYVWWAFGSELAMNFLTGYLVEKTLSVDNLFVILLIFHYFQVPERVWHRILFWGVLGAILTRALFIALGLTLVELFHPIIYVFGVFLVFTGIKLALQNNKKVSPEKNLLLKISSYFFPLDKTSQKDQFFIKKGDKIFATPLWVTLLAIEATDIIFAIDSIPAILAITYNPFIVYTSNIFAILGLRALFFLLAHTLSLFHFLHYGISLILIFVGIKMLLSGYISLSPVIALSVICLILVISILASILLQRKTKG